jgi:hypothetical protein
MRSSAIPLPGTGNKKGPLDDVGSKLSAGDIRQWITSAPEMAAKAKADRKPPMKAYATLTKEEVDDLVAISRDAEERSSRKRDMRSKFATRTYFQLQPSRF